MSNAANGTDAASDTGSWFPVPDEADLPSDLHGLFDKAREQLGFVQTSFTSTRSGRSG